MPANAFEAFLSTPAALAAFGPASVVQALLDFEAALAQAQAAEGLMPAPAAAAIAAQCRAERFDPPAIVAAAGRAGSLAVPLVAALKQRVAQADPSALPWVHWGATSQDAIDTAMALVTRRVLGVLDADLSRLIVTLLGLAERQGDAPMLARTLMQPGSATTLGFKLAGWIAPLLRTRAGIERAAYDALQVQLGGAVGTLAVMGSHGPAVSARMAERLGLATPLASWHTQRDTWVSLGCEVAVLVGALGKIARDWSLLSQPEVGELSEPTEPDRGGSTAMPHGHNPVASMVALAAAQRTPQRAAALLAAMAQEHERGLGNWQAELAEWAGLWTSAAGAVAALADAAPGLAVDRTRMAANLAAQRAHFEIDNAVAAARERSAPWLAALRSQHERQRR
jgi:3-carboxy-cis,cis-muconate cycloisomerase